MKRKQDRKPEDKIEKPEAPEPDPYACDSKQNKRHNARIAALGPNPRRPG